MINSYYIRRINKAIDYIEDNPEDKITLEKLAEVAMFSKYHFHRIFKIVANDTLNNYVKRTKMEKAAKLLITNKNETISNISYRFGYHSNSNFSRDFSDYYGCSPSEFRQFENRPVNRKTKITNDINLVFNGIEEIKDHFVGYTRISTGYNTDTISKSFEKLYHYSLDNGLLKSINHSIGVGYDDPDYTHPDKCRYDACISIDKAKLPDDFPFNTKVIKGGKYATFLFTGKKEDFYNAWDIIFKEWLVSGNYVPDNKPHFELYLHSEEYDKGIFKAKLCLPIKPIKN